MNQIVPLNSSPNQTFLANLTVNGAALKLNLTIAFNEIAQYWAMQIADVNNNVLIAEVPLLTGQFPAANLLGQFQYKQIGSCYLLNVSNGGTALDYPNGQDLGTDFVLLWGIMSSAATNLPRFGRAWNVTIENADGVVMTFGTTPPPGNVFLPEPLHISFETYQTIQQGFWYCDIDIYNLNAPTQNEILIQGMTVTLDAGYQGQPYGTIFKGTLLQPLWTREEGNTDKLTLHCVCGLIESSNNFIGQTIAGGITQRQLVAQMAAACAFPLNADNIDELGSGKVSRASTFFGQPSDFMQELADGNNANLWFTNMAVNIRALRESTEVPTLSYGPGSGLIGTPIQTQDGVSITVLLDARLTLLGQVQLNEGVVIQQLQRSIPSYPTILDQNGLYIIGAVKHHGDSRGNPWYSDITGFVNAGSLLSLQTQF